MVAVVELRSVTKSFGALRVVDDLSFQLAPGETLGVIGPNGAGKTTMFNLIAGELAADSGQVRFEDRDITGLSAHRRCALGIARTHQIPHPFSGITVFENVLVGAVYGRGDRREKEANELSAESLLLTGLAGKANRLAGSLTLLERKRLELARALATEPRVLLLDEIAGGLTEPEVKSLIGTIDAIRGRGISVIWIEHIVHALLSVVDRLLAIDYGRLLMEGEPRRVMASSEVQEIYMGIDVE